MRVRHEHAGLVGTLAALVFAGSLIAGPPDEGPTKATATPAALAAAAPLEAETFSLIAGKRVEPVADAAASGGSFMRFYTTGTIRGSPTIPDTATVTLVARNAEACGSERARFTFKVDGNTVVSGRQTDGNEFSNYTYPRVLAAGSHTFEVSFTNDYFEPRDAFSVTPRKPLTCDRNLDVDVILTAGDPIPPPPPPPPPPEPGANLWRDGGERAVLDEYAALSCASSARVTRVTSPRIEGSYSIRTQLNEGDRSYGERCEESLGNTSASNITRVGGAKALFHFNTESWIAFATYQPLDYVFAPSCSNVSFCQDGGLLIQLKQLGSCGTPALGIVTSGTGFYMRNSARNYCESGSMQSLWQVPKVLGRWVKWLLHVKWHTDANIGYIESWADTDGDGATSLVAIPPSLAGLSKKREGNRIYTHTMKSPTDHPAGSCPESTPCSHYRQGIYRDPDVSGSTHIFHDGANISTDRATATTIAFGGSY